MLEVFRKMLKLNEVDKEWDKTQKKLDVVVESSTLALNKVSNTHKLLIKRTASYYIGEGIGVIK